MEYSQKRVYSKYKSSIANCQHFLSQNSIAQIASAVNAANFGVNASVIKLSEGAYSLSFTGPSGLDNQMRITATGTSNAVSDISSLTVEGLKLLCCANSSYNGTD